jgi:hypothetical protein
VRFASPWADFEHAGIAKIRAEPSHTLVELTADELAAWRKSAEPLHQAWVDGVKKVGVDPAQTEAALTAEIAKYNAGY